MNEFKKRLIAYHAALLVVLSAFIYGSHQLFFQRILDQGKKIGLNPDHPYFNFVKEERQTMDQIFILTVLGIIVILLMAGVSFYFVTKRKEAV